MVLIVSSFIFVLCAFFVSAEQEFPVVNTKLGAVRGRYLESRLGNKFLSFRGIRYAEAPVGSLRFEVLFHFRILQNFTHFFVFFFQPPVPVKAWDGTFNATEDGPICIQFTRSAAIQAIMNEDCLRLNIYTRNTSPERNRPVIFYIHPGAFFESSGRSAVHGPHYFMDHDVVLVTINYRLGILGFLSTGTKESPGNNGLKDQVVALKWIQENIETFGGNPNAVTLMGYSAGAHSAMLHIVSPMSQNLFHRTIIMSGSATRQAIVPFDQLDLAKKQVRLLNCSDESIESIMECFKNVMFRIFICNCRKNFFNFFVFDRRKMKTLLIRSQNCLNLLEIQFFYIDQ